MNVIEYGRMGLVAQATGASLTSGTETTLITVTDPKFLDKSQLGLFIDQVLGSATSVAFGIYFSYNGGTDWHKLSVEDLTTNKGDLVDIPPYVDVNSPVFNTTHRKTYVPIPIPPATALKVTATAAGGNGGAYVITVAVRNN